MGMILCATRGGEASYPTQDAVIALAKKQGDELTFLYVADISFLNQTAAPMVVDVESRLEKLGQGPGACSSTGHRSPGYRAHGAVAGGTGSGGRRDRREPHCYGRLTGTGCHL